MHCVVYVSRALVARGSAPAQSMLDSSRRNNARDGLTGFLHREGDTFLQYLEGPSAPLEATWRRILADPRHRSIRMLHAGEMPVRLFPDWEMGYADESVSRFAAFLEEASRKHTVTSATGLETTAFLRAVAQRVDLGLGATVP